MQEVLSESLSVLLLYIGCFSILICLCEMIAINSKFFTGSSRFNAVRIIKIHAKRFIYKTIHIKYTIDEIEGLEWYHRGIINPTGMYFVIDESKLHLFMFMSPELIVSIEYSGLTKIKKLLRFKA
jgi:hypothetical protein